MYSKGEAFQIHLQLHEEKQKKTRLNFHFHSSALIAYAISLQRALKIVSSVHPWANQIGQTTIGLAAPVDI